MFDRKPLLLYLFFLALYSCNSNKGNDLTVIKAKYIDDYPYPCVLYNDHKKLNIEYIYKYKNGKLVEYEGCASEGFYTVIFKESKDYTKEDWSKKVLDFKYDNKKITFFNKEYQIFRKSNDSIYTVFKENEYLIFVGNILNQ